MRVFAGRPNWFSLLIFCCSSAVWAQTEGAATPGKAQAEMGQRAVDFILQRYAVNQAVKVEKTGQPLPPDGSWSVGKQPPAECHEGTTGCVAVLYRVAQADVLCEWSVQLPGNGDGGQVLEENGDAARYLLRKVTPEEAKGLVNARTLPRYPPIAAAAHVTGQVMLRATVGEGSALTGLALLSGPEMLRGAAIDAARLWTFAPLMVGSRSVPYQVVLTFTFTEPGPVNSARVTAAP